MVSVCSLLHTAHTKKCTHIILFYFVSSKQQKSDERNSKQKILKRELQTKRFDPKKVLVFEFLSSIFSFCFFFLSKEVFKSERKRSNMIAEGFRQVIFTIL